MSAFDTALAWRECVAMINVSEGGCDSCPNENERARYPELCIWENASREFPDCDFDGDGCPNSDDEEPCNPEEKCECKIDFTQYAESASMVLFRWLVDGVPDGTTYADLLQMTPVGQKGSVAWSVNMNSEFGNAVGTVALPLGSSMPSHSQLPAQVLTLLDGFRIASRSLLIAVCSYYAARAVLREIGTV